MKATTRTAPLNTTDVADTGIWNTVHQIRQDATLGRIRSGSIMLTPLQNSHVHTHFQWNNDPELNRLDSEVPFQKESFGTFLNRFEQLMQTPDPEACDLEIMALEHGLIGVAYVDQIQPFNRQCRVGITIGDVEHRRQGFGRETLRLLLGYLFRTVNVHRVMAEAFDFNTAWKGLLEAVGFQCEGRQRDYLHRDGRYWDKLIYAMLDDEFERLYGSDVEVLDRAQGG